MHALDQMKAHRAELVQHTQIHRLPGLGPEALHDRLSHLAQTQAVGGATAHGEQPIGKLVSVALGIFLDVAAAHQGRQQPVGRPLAQAQPLGQFADTQLRGIGEGLQNGKRPLHSGDGVTGRLVHDSHPR